MGLVHLLPLFASPPDDEEMDRRLFVRRLFAMGAGIAVSGELIRTAIGVATPLVTEHHIWQMLAHYNAWSGANPVARPQDYELATSPTTYQHLDSAIGVIRRYAAGPSSLSFSGIKVAVDPTVPPGAVELHRRGSRVRWGTTIPRRGMYAL